MRTHDSAFSGRLARFVDELLTPAVYPHRVPMDVQAWEVTDEPVPFEVATSQRFEPFAAGTWWGQTWGTVWFHITAHVPTTWQTGRHEVLVDLGFHPDKDGAHAEALAWRPDGTIIKGIEPFNRHIPVTPDETGRIELYLEAAANPDIALNGIYAPTPQGDKATASIGPLYQLHFIDLALFDEDAWQLRQDVRVLSELLDELDHDTPRRAAIVEALDRAMDELDPDDVAGTIDHARRALAPALAAPAHASAHRIVATGHAHIDSAWLWPTRETIRKCARTFANVVDLMDTYPDMVFSCSSAQQYQWVRDRYPDLWTRIKDKVAGGQFIPIGGMWVESDTNMPGGEAMVRQFLEGKRFFLSEFGVEPHETWLPDSFGYSAALPQIAHLAGNDQFVTQKISWNDTNTMPHHTFWWEGIDGTRVYTHFPPVDTYNSTLSATELAKAERQFLDQGKANTSLVPFGFGDGGGGPTREMIATAKRTADLEGSPRVRIGTVSEFFADSQDEYPDPQVWTGELYLENHRGTYTSQLRTKQGNRRCEHALREAELWAATATVRLGVPYPAERLRACWQIVLLQQFHDILPGTSISWVHHEAEAGYAKVLAWTEEITTGALTELAGNGNTELLANAGPLPQDSVPALGICTTRADRGQTCEAATCQTLPDGTLQLSNGQLTVAIDSRGLITSLRDASGREAVPDKKAMGLFQVHRDRPNMYEAWDIDRHYRRGVTDLDHADAIDVLPMEVPSPTHEARDRTPERSATQATAGDAAIRVRRHFRSSQIDVTYRLRSDSPSLDIELDIDWHEHRTLLKYAFPVDVHTDRAASEIQFGHVFRPTHTNTSWDEARYETCAHRWVHVSEPGFGLAVANDSTYGWDISRHHSDHSATPHTVIRASVIRGPQFPDPSCDQGRHQLRFAIRPGDIGVAIAEGYRLNLPTRRIRGRNEVRPLVDVEGNGVLIEAVKLADDGSGDVIVRLYESRGARTRARLRPAFTVTGAVVTDLLERSLPPGELPLIDGAVDLPMHPFTILTVRLRRAVGAAHTLASPLANHHSHEK